MRPLPLKWRVSLLMGAAVLIGMAFIGLTSYLEMKESLTGSLDRTLETMAGSVMAVLNNPAPNSDAEQDVQAIVGDTTRRQGPAYRVWFDHAPGGLASSGERAEMIDATALALRAPPAVGGRDFFDVGGGGERQRAIWARKALKQGTANVVIAMSRHPALEALEEFRNGLLYAAGGIVLITIGVTTLLVAVALRPIGRTARALGAVTDRNVGNPQIQVGPTPAELEPFVNAVTEMLARLAAALEEQKRFVSDASHELRTPLSVARSTIEAVRVRNRTPGQYRKALDEVREDLERMGDMVEDLLTMARLDETSPADAAEAFDLAELAEELADAYQAKAAEHGARLALDLQPVSVRGNRTQVRRLLSNLLDNALRYGPEGGTVSVSVAPPEAGFVEVRVHDEGGAVPADALPHLFDRFYRADQSRARATGGVGLGLSIAREIALRHGGDITVASAPSEGTSFRLRLPAV